MERAYKKLWGVGGTSENIFPESEVDGIPFLTEKNFIHNIRFVIGTESPFFGKMLYLYFSQGFDQAKISLARFVDGLKPYVIDEERQKHNQTSFKILDIDRDRVLNIINLLHLFKKLPSNSRLGQEIF